MDVTNKNKIKQIIKEKYAPLSKSSKDMSANTDSSFLEMEEILKYSKKDIACATKAHINSLGCGNPVTKAELLPGETVVDIGCGAGLDAFLSARKVTKSGYVIGVDMTSEMIKKEKKNADKLKVKNVDFRLGEIEKLPVADNIANVVMSNCVINLSTNKTVVYKEIFRILKPGGRISISDILKAREIPQYIMDNSAAYTG